MIQRDNPRTIGGSAFNVDWGEGYDIVLLTNFLHHFECIGLSEAWRPNHGAQKPRQASVSFLFETFNPDILTRHCIFSPLSMHPDRIADT